MTMNYDPRHTSYKAPADTGPSITDIDQELRDLSDAAIERYARDLDLAEVGAKRWEALDEYTKKAMRASNELARRKRVRDQAAAKAADDQRIEAQHTTLVEAKIAAFKSQARGAFPGTNAQFDAAWPRILEDWQISQAREHMDADLARHRARMGDLL